MTPYLAIAIALSLIVGGIIILHKLVGNKRHIKWIGPIAMIRTHRGVHFIDRTAKISPRFWRGFATSGIVITFFLMGLMIYTLIMNAHYILRTPTSAPGAFLIIPGITAPLWGGLLGIIILLIAHEFSHGIVARAENIRVKSVGTLTLGLIPLGAFVEPDEKQLKKSKALTQLRVFAAGSFMNILLSVLILVVILFLVIPNFTTPVEGLLIKTVEPGSPVEASGIETGHIVTEMNGVEILTIMDFLREIDNNDMQPGDTVKLTTNQGSYTLEAATREDGSGFIGIQSACGTIPKGIFFAAPIALRSVDPACYPVNAGVNSTLFWAIFGTVIWIIIINYGVGLFNLLPIKPLDGGLMIESVTKKYIPKSSAKTVLSITLFTLSMLLINILGPYFWKFFA